MQLLNDTLGGAIFYSKQYITQRIMQGSGETLLIECMDLLLFIPLYTFTLYHIMNLVMYNFKKSPFKAFAFFPAIFDIPETLLFIVNNLFFKTAPIMTGALPILSFFKWTLGLVIVVVIIIFSLAKLMGVRGTIKIMSYEDLWSNSKNVKTYWTWLGGHLATTILSILAILVIYPFSKVVPGLTLVNLGIAVGWALLYDYIFNKFMPIPAEIFNRVYNHWLRAVFISADSLLLALLLSFFSFF
jgi:hypothetical protein